ncbi:MAG: hypothetical protein ACE15E_21370 [Acidobacteriota bacterium]
MIVRKMALIAALCLSVGYASPQDSGGSPEEPDFFFMTGGPYTQQKHSPQIIWGQQWLSGTTKDRTVKELSGSGRVEFGITDFLEADFEFGLTRASEEFPAFTQVETQLDGLMLGTRYRVLREEFAPFTLTIGPQFLIPTSTSRPWETGSGYGVDVTAAKDWGGPIFAAASINWRNTPGVRAIPEGPSASLQELAYAFALGLRPLEHATGNDTRHDLHVFLELQTNREDAIEGSEISRSTTVFLAPGTRYGFLNKRGILAEVGVALPIGLDRDAPDWGAILQLQIEAPSLF